MRVEIHAKKNSIEETQKKVMFSIPTHNVVSLLFVELVHSRVRILFIMKSKST